MTVTTEPMPAPLSGNRSLLILTAAYLVVFIFSAIAPSSRAVWIAEIIPAVGILAGIWWFSRKLTFSNTAYVLMFIWLALHTIGAKLHFRRGSF